jgi:SAM-dependent methyltransferase
MNRYHRWYCRSDRWKSTLDSAVLPWVLRDYPLGDHLLEVGPGPGLTTDLLRQRVPAMTCIEIDERLAASLAGRMRGSNVTVELGDATRMLFADASFSSAVALTMLHHVPSSSMQDRLISEVFRVLKPSSVFLGSDSTVSLSFRVAHLFDTMVLVEPATFGKRLESAGFEDVAVREGKGAFRWRARKPATTS